MEDSTDSNRDEKIAMLKYTYEQVLSSQAKPVGERGRADFGCCVILIKIKFLLFYKFYSFKTF